MRQSVKVRGGTPSALEPSRFAGDNPLRKGQPAALQTTWPGRLPGVAPSEMGADVRSSRQFGAGLSGTPSGTTHPCQTWQSGVRLGAVRLEISCRLGESRSVVEKKTKKVECSFELVRL